MGPGMYYHMQKLKGLEVAALYQQGDEEKQQSVPPHWKVYFTVDDIQKSSEQAKESGGSVIFGSMEVFDAGHAAILQDPQGAVFALWQAKDHIGARIKGETGAVTWNELMTNSAAEATEFYTGLLGITSSKMPGPIDYTMLQRRRRRLGGGDADHRRHGTGPATLDGVLWGRRCGRCGNQSRVPRWLRGGSAGRHPRDRPFRRTERPTRRDVFHL